MASLGDLLGGIVAMIALAVGLMVFGTILPNLNQAAIGTSAYQLITQTSIIVAAVGLLSIVMLLFSVTRQ